MFTMKNTVVVVVSDDIDAHRRKQVGSELG